MMATASGVMNSAATALYLYLRHRSALQLVSEPICKKLVKSVKPVQEMRKMMTLHGVRIGRRPQ